MSSIFICHASPDQAFALRLARSLEQLGHVAWVDTREIQVGASIPQSVAEAAEGADYLIVVLSKHSVASSWCEHEWYAKYWHEIVARQTLVLPALLDDCTIPFFLRPKHYADFRSEYAVGLAQLSNALQTHTKARSFHDDVPSHLDRRPAAERSSGTSFPVDSQFPFCYADDTMSPAAELTEVSVELEIPYLGRISGSWTPDERELDAAWELYVELVTRISVAELAASEGLLRESLTSLYSIFTTTRQILRRYGPAIARPKAKGQLSLGYLAISLLNFVLRPVLAQWHPRLLDYEHRRDAAVSAFEHEAAWERAGELRAALNQVRCILLDYTSLLAQISRVPTLPSP